MPEKPSFAAALDGLETQVSPSDASIETVEQPAGPWTQEERNRLIDITLGIHQRKQAQTPAPQTQVETQVGKYVPVPTEADCRKGGLARKEALSPARRKEIGRRAVQARWDRVREAARRSGWKG